MSKHITADKLIAEIERMREINRKAFEAEHIESGIFHGRTQAINHLLGIITSLQQEQPEVEFEDKFVNFLERKDAELGANSWSEEDLRELAEYFYLNNKQPEVDLDKFDKEVTKIWGKCAAEPKDSIACFHIETFNEIARQFYELGLKARNK